METADHGTDQPVRSSCSRRQRNRRLVWLEKGVQGRRRQGQVPWATFATVGTLDFTLAVMRSHLMVQSRIRPNLTSMLKDPSGCWKAQSEGVSTVHRVW